MRSTKPQASPTARDKGAEQARADGKGSNRPTISIYEHVGHEMRGKRVDLNLELRQLGEALDVPVEDLQAYEAGTRRIDIHLLLEIASLMDVDPSYFFRRFDLDCQLRRSEALLMGGAESIDDIRVGEETRVMLDLFQRIRDPEARLRVIRLAAECIQPPSPPRQGSELRSTGQPF